MVKVDNGSAICADGFRDRPNDYLKPCPFCGAQARREDLTDPGNEGGSCIACMKCGACSSVHFDRKENLASSWNQRVPLPMIQEKDLREVAAKLFTADPMSPVSSAFVEGAKYATMQAQ